MSIFCHDNITHNIALILIILWQVVRLRGVVMMPKKIKKSALVPCPHVVKLSLNLISGTVTGLTNDAKQTIDVLKLGDSLQQNQKLVDIRKQAIANFCLVKVPR
jgi:hypothetical protein